MKPADGIRFLRDFQELLAQGGFVATYKFALLQALADLSVEQDAAPDGSLSLHVERIADKFIEYYWNQARPFRETVLRQNTRGQAKVVQLLQKYRTRSDGKLARFRGSGQDWQLLRREVAATIIEMPLWKLQTIGNKQHEFLYHKDEYSNRTIRLLPGVPWAFRSFHALLTGLIRDAWIAQIHRIGGNREILGPGAELEEFLFGSDRSSLKRFCMVLRDHQAGACFYCGKNVQNAGDLDHFIPWARYPIDLGHNFVFAHKGCNNAKHDYLAGVDHLERWRVQNLDEHALSRRFQDAGLIHDLERTVLIARWAYEQGQANKAQLWIRRGEFEECDYRWRTALSVPGGLRLAAEDPPVDDSSDIETPHDRVDPEDHD